MEIGEAAVILHLHIKVPHANQAAFSAYVAEAFPVFEHHGDCVGAVYVDASDPENLDEVFYYRTEEAFQAGERAIQEDPRQVALLERWRALIDGPPRVVIERPWSLEG